MDPLSDWETPRGNYVGCSNLQQTRSKVNVHSFLIPTAWLDLGWNNLCKIPTNHNKTKPSSHKHQMTKFYVFRSVIQYQVTWLILSEPIVAAGNASQINLALWYAQDSIERTAQVRAIANMRKHWQTRGLPCPAQSKARSTRSYYYFVRGVSCSLYMGTYRNLLLRGCPSVAQRPSKECTR
jgi:hypothetical protein